MNKGIKIGVLLSCLVLAFSSCKNEKNNNDNNTNINEDDYTEEEISLDGEKIIVTDGINEEISVYDYIPLHLAYGLCNNHQFKADASVTKPNGDVVNVSDKLYVDQEGIYDITFKSTIGDEQITKNIKVNANYYSTKPLFDYTNASFVDDDVVISDNITKYSANKGAEYQFAIGTSTLKYKNVINLKEVEGNLIELSPNPNSPKLDISTINVKITDAYDSNKNITVVFKMNDAANYPDMWQHGAMNTFAKVEYYGNSLADTSQYPVLKDYTVLWDQGMWTTYESDNIGQYTPVSFAYDYESMALKACDRVSKWEKPNQWITIYDLDNPDDNVKDFEGWTTGEVFLSIECPDAFGELIITKIGNQYLTKNNTNLFELSTGELLTKGYEFGNLPQGAVNYYYPLADVSSSQSEVNCHLYKKDNENKVEIENVDFNNFYPTESGKYLIEYGSYNFFNKRITKEGEFIINDEPTNIEDLSSVNLHVKLFESSHIPTFTYSGGNGVLVKKIELVIGNEVKECLEGHAFVVDKKENVNKIRVVVSDSIRNQKVFEYPIQVDYDVVKFDLIDSFDSVSVIEGNEFVVPNYQAIDYSKEDISKTNIPVLIRQGKNQAYQPGDKITINTDTSLTYSSGNNVLKTINISSVPYDISSSNVGEQFVRSIGVDSISSCMSGLNFYSNGNSNMEIYQPYPVSTSNLYISLVVFPDLISYDAVNIDLYALNSNYLHFELEEIKSGKPTLFMNGIKSSCRVESILEKYTYTDIPSLRQQDYYTYTFVVDGAKKALLNTAGMEVDQITTWANGTDFTKFDKACTLIKYSVNNPTAGDLFSIYRVSNQLLTTVGTNYGDLAAPTLGFEERMQSASFEKDDYFLIPKGYAYDVFSGAYNLQMSIIDSDGEYTLAKTNVSQYPITFAKYGSYTINYTFKDARDNGGSTRFILVVRDNIPPTITLASEYKESYRAGFKIIQAIVKDNYDKNPNLSIFIADKNNKRTPISSGDIAALSKGTYRIIYYASDKEGNSTRLVRQVNVLEGVK